MNAPTAAPLPDSPLPLTRVLSEKAAAHPDKPFVMHRERVLGYAEFLALTQSAAGVFGELGLGRGDRVAVLCRKTPEAVVAFLAAAAHGAIFFPADFFQPPAVARGILDRHAPKILVVAKEFLPNLAAMYPEGPPFAVVGTDFETTMGASPLVRNLSRLPALPNLSLSPNDPAYLNFTSGTTGAAKGAVTTLANLYWNTRASVEALNLTPDDVHLCMMPIFVHPHEIFCRPLLLGGTLVLTENISPKNVAGLISGRKVSCLMAVASIYETLARLSQAERYDFSSLRVPESGGMHVTAALVKAMRKRFGVTMLPVWGSTETAGIALATPADAAYRPRSMGRPCPHYRVRAVDKRGQEVEVGQKGELEISGPGVCPGYFGLEAAPGAALFQGRFLTGDIVKRDADGFYYFRSRRHHLMKVGGMKVYPTEVEEALRHHPDVMEAVVVPVKDGLRGEIPKAVIVAREGSRLSQTDVRRFLEDRLHRHKIPRMVEFLPALPRTPGGKIAWRKLLSE